jgi:hypothetical protein
LKTSKELKFVVKLSSGKILSRPMSYKDAQPLFINLFEQVSGVLLIQYDPREVVQELKKTAIT